MRGALELLRFIFENFRNIAQENEDFPAVNPNFGRNPGSGHHREEVQAGAAVEQAWGGEMQAEAW